jgi:hypothetical protein
MKLKNIYILIKKTCKCEKDSNKKNKYKISWKNKSKENKIVKQNNLKNNIKQNK